MRAQFHDVSKTLQGDMVISFRIPDIDLNKIEKLKDKPLDLEIKKHSEKRSLNANAYFWQLCDKIAKKLGSDKDTIYLRQLRSYGVFQDIEIIPEAIELFKREFRYMEIFDDGYGVSDIATVRCYFGSSKYNTKEMSELIEGTVRDAEDLGIETLTSDEIAHMCSLWKGESNEGHTENR